jgi:hypothetical protein
MTTTTTDRLGALQRRLDYLDAQLERAAPYGETDRTHRIAAEAGAIRWALSVLRPLVEQRSAQKARPTGYEAQRDARRAERERSV